MGSGPCWWKRMLIGCAITAAHWRRPIGGGWAKAKAAAEMIASASTPKAPKMCGFTNCIPKPAPSCKPAPSRCWRRARCLRPPSEKTGHRRRWTGCAWAMSGSTNERNGCCVSAGLGRGRVFAAALTRWRRPKGPISCWKIPDWKSIWPACWRRTSSKPPGAWRPNGW